MQRHVAWSSAQPTATLLERDDEIEAVVRRVAVPPPRLAATTIVGEPGIGKSALWAHGCAVAARHGTLVLDTACAAAECDMPYAGLEALFGDLFDTHATALPVPHRAALDAAFLRAETTGTEPRSVASATLALLRRAVEDGGVLLAIDDVPWLDAETHGCLGYALRRLVDAPVALLATAREQCSLWTSAPGPAENATLIALVEKMLGAEAVTVRPSPLSVTAIGQLYRDRLGMRLGVAECEQVVAATGGNPFWALEWGQCPSMPGEHIEAPKLVPPRLERLVVDRVDGLESTVIHATCLVAALGRPRPSTVLRALAADCSDEDDGARRAEGILDSAVRAELLRMDGDRLVPAHPLIGTGLLASLTPFRRRRLYRQAAGLADCAEARANHLLRARGEAGHSPSRPSTSDDVDNELLTALDEASAAALRRGAARVAAQFATHALALLEQGGSDSTAGGTAPVEVSGRRSMAMLSHRRVSLAEMHCQAREIDRVLTVLEHLDLRDLDVDLLERAVPMLAESVNDRRGGDAARAVTEAVASLPEAGLGLDERTRREALVCTLRADPQCGAVGDRRAVAERAVACAEASSTQLPLRRRALGALAFTMLATGEPIDDVLVRLDALGTPSSFRPGSGADVELLHGLRRWSVADIVGAREVFSEAFERGLATGDMTSTTVSGAALAYAELESGWSILAQETVDRLGRNVDLGEVECPYVIHTRGELYLARGEHDALERLIDGVVAARNCSARHLSVDTRFRGLLALRRDDPVRGVEYLDRYVALAERHGLFDIDQFLSAQALLGDALVAAGDYDRAVQIADRLETATAGTDHTVLRGKQRRILATVAARRDNDLERAMAWGIEACELHARCPIATEYGLSLVAVADIHGQRGEQEAAGMRRSHAHSIFTKAGHTWWAERTSNVGSLHASGRLSRAEYEVFKLVVAGATNRAAAETLHLSIRTVENHLRSAYRKIGVRSRSELRSRAATAE